MILAFISITYTSVPKTFQVFKEALNLIRSYFLFLSLFVIWVLTEIHDLWKKIFE